MVASPDIDSLTSTGVKSNSNVHFNYTVPAGTYLWAGIRAYGYNTQPKLAGLCMEWKDGLALTKATAGALTGAGPWSGKLDYSRSVFEHGSRARFTRSLEP